jgi:hypothetical protein
MDEPLLPTTKQFVKVSVPVTELGPLDVMLKSFRVRVENLRIVIFRVLTETVFEADPNILR